MMPKSGGEYEREDVDAGLKPLVSVVIPAYNSSATLRETIDSVLHQSFKDFELLVIDDGSTDTTKEIINDVRDSRVCYFSFDNAGPSAARNRGIELAAGQFIAFLDADDLWLPGKLAAQIDALRHNPEAALVFSWSDSIDESGAFLKKGNYVHLENNIYEQLIKWNFLENGSTPMVRQSALLDSGVFDEAIRLGEDWDMWLRLAHRHPIICIPEVHVLYRVRQNSATSNVKPVAKETLRVLQSALDRLPPTRDRDRLERTAKANLYQYLALRLVETSTTRQTGFEAAGYWWQFVITTPNLLSQLKRIALIGGAIFAILILPASQFTRLRQRWSRLRE
ncbi:MAG: glycosyltransferase [Gammaproteobacteria bacterium]|nr:glycosyltransferase [Gammaproteobacteria bacterium]MDP7419002.1 glycosyltransferase [Gammaproteobacteria bacterium]